MDPFTLEVFAASCQTPPPGPPVHILAIVARGPREIPDKAVSGRWSLLLSHPCRPEMEAHSATRLPCVRDWLPGLPHARRSGLPQPGCVRLHPFARSTESAEDRERAWSKSLDPSRPMLSGSSVSRSLH